jgi:thiol-disulfide isomerase/thioredoxin
VPAHLAGAVAVGLPLLEAVTAMLLVLRGPLPSIGGLLAVGLLAAFSAALARTLSRGGQTSCRCFGALSRKPLSRRSLYRNAVLASIAIIAAVPDEDADVPRVLGRLDASDWAVLLALVALTAVIGLAALVFSLLRSNGTLLLRLEALERGGSHSQPQRAPTFVLPDLDGHLVSSQELLANGVPVLLLFMSPDCGPCSDLAPRVEAWRERYRDGLTIAVVSEGSPEANREKFPHGRLHVLIEQDSEVSDLFGIDGTPAAVVLTAEGKVADKPAYGAPDIVEVVEALTLDADAGAVELARPVHDPVGSALPPATVYTLQGEQTTLDEHVPEDAVLLLWDTTCGFAGLIQDDVLAWQSEEGAATDLVVVSGGDTDAVRGAGFGGTVLLDPHFSAGDALGAPGTPSAVLVRGGVVASPVAAGGTAVLDLLRRASSMRSSPGN